MKLTELHDRLLGEWTGTSHLWLSPPPNPSLPSESRMSVKSKANGKFLALTYSWSYEGVEQKGLLLVGNANKAETASAAWVDSWHQGSSVMQCKGQVNESGVISLLGSYPAPPNPDWGWRFTITPTAQNQLRITMHNISPAGTEELAVQADYTRRK